MANSFQFARTARLFLAHRNLTEFHGISLNISVLFRALLWPRVIPCSSVAPCDSVYVRGPVALFRVLPCSSVLFRVLPCSSVLFRGPV